MPAPKQSGRAVGYLSYRENLYILYRLCNITAPFARESIDRSVLTVSYGTVVFIDHAVVLQFEKLAGIEFRHTHRLVQVFIERIRAFHFF